jgi:hypothetical protein
VVETTPKFSQIHQKVGKVQATSINMKNIKGKLRFKGIGT